MKIYNAKDVLLLDIEVDDTSYRNRVIMGDHNLTLRYSLAEHIELPVGSYCDFQGQRYTLERPEDFKKIHSRNYDYTVVFQSVEYKARIWKFRNPVDGRLKFPLTATPKEHLQMFVDNMNRRDPGWTLGDCIDGTEVLINYDHDFCRDALAKMASELKTEYYFEGKRVSLNKLEVNKDNPLPLSYGRGNGFKTGVGRTNSGDNPPTEILYVQGGTDNIDRSKYPPLEEERVRASSGGCLLLPRNASLQFDGECFEGEDGFNPDLARTYVTDDLGLSIRAADRVLSSLAEDSIDCSSIYPKRVGEISEVIRISKEDGDLYDIVDKDIPESLNYEECIIGEETMTIIFQTGMLAGKEFDAKYYHEATNINGHSQKGRRFEIVPQEIDGIMMPGDCFVPVAGDKYAVFHCFLPDAYINAYTGDHPEKKGAEWDMFREAVKHLYDAEQLHFSFSGTLDGIWAKKDWANIGGRIVLGGFVLFSDPTFEKDGVRVRITGIKDYVNNPHSPEIELSNSTTSGSVSTTLKELGAEEVTVEENYNSAIRFTRRRFRDAQETTNMLEKALLKNFSETINPISVHTMQMLVGDESLQFEFVAYIPADDATQQPPVVAHEVTWQEDSRTLKIGDGIIKHLTLDLPKYLTSGHKPQAYHYWPVTGLTTGELSDAEQSYYLYAKVPRNGGTGVFRLEPSAHSLAEGDDYWLLVGVLNSEYGGTRSFAALYGFSEILPGRITTDRVVSGDGESYFDMVGERMKLGDKLSYNADGNRELILRGTLVQSQSGQTEYLGCFRGEWNASYTYFKGDEVTYRNEETNTTSMFRYINDTSISGIVPTNTAYWQVVAQGSQGTQGQDGLGYEFIYKRTDNSTAPTTPTATSQEDNFVPDGWTADPSGVTSEYQWEWQCSRKKTNGVWGTFIGSAADNSVAALWAKYGATGATGDYTEIRYAANGSPTVYPPFNTKNLDRTIWLTSLDAAQAEGTYVWQTTALRSSDGLIKRFWSTPVRLTGVQGPTGEAGSSPALCFRGTYRNNEWYYGTKHRVDAVRIMINGVWKYYVARTDAGETADGAFKGYAPPDEQKWNSFGASFESVATGLLLAENANIANLIFRNQCLESTNKNIDGNPNLLINGITGNMYVDGSIINPFKRIGKSNLKRYFQYLDEYKEWTVDIEKTGLKIALQFTKREAESILKDGSYSYVNTVIYLPPGMEYIGAEFEIINLSTDSHAISGPLLNSISGTSGPAWDALKKGDSLSFTTTLIKPYEYMRFKCMPLLPANYIGSFSSYVTSEGYMTPWILMENKSL